MTAPRGRRGDAGPLEGGFSGASIRGALLIAVAVIVGVLLLAQGLDRDVVSSAPQDPSDESSGATDDTTDTTGTDSTGTTIATTATTHVPAEVRVIVLNGGGPVGSAGTASTALTTLGFTTLGAENTADVTVSAVYYAAGYDADAVVIAQALNITTPTAPLPTPAPEGAPAEATVVVVLGPDFVPPT